MAGFVFFDTETTGLRPGWDQIIHFAAIRTDENLHEVARFEARSRLQPHVVPHPQALLTNGLSIEQLTDRNLPSHYQMVCRIRRQLLSWSPAVFVGYNSIRFDEEMLRHALFHSLHQAYLTSNHNNARADVMGLAIAASALHPDSLAVPVTDGGRRTFKLALLAEANGIQIDKAHDAISDAAVALQLARRLRDRCPELWSRFVQHSRKATVTEFVESECGFILTEFFGNDAYHRVVANIGSLPSNPNGRLCLDLSVDPEHWATLGDDDLRAEVCRKGGPVRRLAVNAGPTLTALWEAPAEMLQGLDVDTAEQRAEWLTNRPEVTGRVAEAYVGAWADRPPPAHLEDRLYHDGFPGPDDERRMEEFHEVTASGSLRLASEFDDPRLRTYARQIIYGERRSSFEPEARRDADRQLAIRLTDPACGGTTLSAAIAEVDRLKAQEGVHSAELDDYRAWLAVRLERALEFVATA